MESKMPDRQIAVVISEIIKNALILMVLCIALLMLNHNPLFSPGKFEAQSVACSNGIFYWDNSTECNITSARTCENATIYAQCDIIVSNSAVWNTTDVLIYLNQTSADQYKIIVKGNAKWVGKDIEVEDFSGSYDSAIEIGVDNTESGFADWTNITNNDDIDFVCYHNSQVNMTNSIWDYGTYEHFGVFDDCMVDIYGSSEIDRTYPRLYNEGTLNNYGNELLLSNGFTFYLDCSNCSLNCYRNCSMPSTKEFTLYLSTGDYAIIRGYFTFVNFYFVYSSGFIYREIPFTIYQDSGTTPVSSGCNISIKRPDGITDDYALTNSEGKVNLTIFVNSTFENSNYEVYANGTWIANITPENKSFYPNGIVIYNVTSCNAPATYNATITVTPNVIVADLNSSLSNTSTFTLSVIGDKVDITLSYSNYTYTTLTPNQTTWSNFNGTATFTINISRTAQETKSRKFVLNFTADGNVGENDTIIIHTKVRKHPLAIFENISETPGYTYNKSGIAPYTTWNDNLILYANTYDLDYNFSDPSKDEELKSRKARRLALVYLMTQNETYAKKAVEGLKYINVMAAKNYPSDGSKGRLLVQYLLAYDFVVEYLIENNASLFEKVRRDLANITDYLYSNYDSTGLITRWAVCSAIGTASIILKDYDSEFGSGPGDWLVMGRDYMFVQDNTSNGRSAMEYVMNSGGLYLLPSYFTYADKAFFEYLNIYNYNYRNLSSYAIPTSFINSIIIQSYPFPRDKDYGLPSFITSGSGYSSTYYNEIIWYVANTIPSPLKEHMMLIAKSLDENDIDDLYGYLYYNNSIDTIAPDWLLNASNNYEQAVFRSGWTNGSLYLRFSAFHYPIESDRYMTHHDSMNIDYWAFGDSLIPDSGEVKYREYGYGPIYAKGHNTIMISNSTGDNPGGIIKGFSSLTAFDNPAYFTYSLKDNSLSFAEAETNISKVESTLNTGEQDGTNYLTLSKPVKWRRTVLFPNAEYFIIFDYLNNSLSREIQTLFHLSSFRFDPNYNFTKHFDNSTDLSFNSTSTTTHSINVTEPISKSVEIKIYVSSVDGSGEFSVYLNGNYLTNLSGTGYKFIRGINTTYLNTGINNVTYNTSSDINVTIDYTQIWLIGLVDGNLEVESQATDWKSQTYNVEQNITSGYEIAWNTTNMNGDKIQMHLYHLPKSNISIEKFWTRIGCYSSGCEVDHPLVRFKLNTQDKFYGITAFYTRYATNSEWTFTNLSITGGTGNALKISNGTWTDWIIHANKSYVTADEVKTDGAYVWVRNDTEKKFFIRDGKNLTFSNTKYFSSNDTVDYMLMNLSSDGRNATVVISSTNSPLKFSIYGTCSSSAVVKRDGITLNYGTDWGCVNDGEFWIKSSFSEHTFTILGAKDTTPPAFSNWQQNPPDLNSSSVGKLYINVTITDDSGVNDSSVRFYHWINDSQYPNQPWCFIDGNAWDFECEHNMTNITSSIFNITLHTYAYNPSTHNVHPDTMSSATKYNYSLSANNKALKVRFYNISTNPNTTYILKSKLYKNSGDLLVYYCNSSYTSGKVYNSEYCIPIATLTSQENTTYQNIHFYGDENSRMDGVGITSTGYIIFYALHGSDWEVEYANIDSDSVETTNNGGTGWTNQDFTPDAWIIQLNGNGLTTFGYKVYACDMAGNCGNSSIQEDFYAIANLPPSPAPEIITPKNSTYFGIFNITWTPSKDPNSDPFNYSLYLYHSNGALADILADNNITEGTEYFTFDSTQYPKGQYYLMVNATDDAGNTNFYITPYYFTLTNSPILKFKPPTEPNGTAVPRNWTEINMTIDEPNLDTFDFDWDYTEPDDYLVGYWRFDNNSEYGEDNTHFYDYSGTGNNGTCSGGYCPTYVKGKKQLGLEFDGSNDYVSVSDDESLDITDKITIELWVYPEYTGDYQTLIHKGSSSNILGNEEFSYNVRRSPTNYIGFSLNIVGSGWNSVGGTQIPDKRWSYIVCTYNGSVMKVYKNGVLVGSKDASGSIVSSDYNLKIGDTGNAGDPFNGTIDEVRIYNKSLSAEEVKQRYLSTRARYYDDSLVLAMNFNNNSAIGENSTKAVDISKYGNNGTIHGATWTTGKFGKALNFDGVDDYVDCGNDSSLRPQTLTWELWFKRNSATGEALDELLRNSYYKDRIVIDNANGHLYFEIGTTDDDAFWCDSGVVPVDGVWYYVVATYDGQTQKIYVSGELKNSLDIGKEILYGSDPLMIGYGAVNRAFNGIIDEVRIYNRALTPDEIKMHYLSEFQKYNSTQWRFYNNITDLEEGTYTYYGWANDTAGNEGESEVREVTIDTTQPTISNEAINDTKIYIGESIYLNCSVTDNIEVDTVKFYIEPFGNLTASNINSEYYIICNATNPCNTNKAGQYTWTSVWANDTANNVNTTTVGLSYTVVSPRKPIVNIVELLRRRR